MYTEYFGFREEPFADSADLRFFYTNPLCQKAYSTLLSGIREYKGFLLLTGEPGTGKTTILRRVMNDLEVSSHSLFFDSTSLTCTSIDDLLSFICTQLGMQEDVGGKSEKLHAFRSYLSTLASKGGTGVLVIDEAHHLSEDVLNGLRMIAPIDPKSERLLLQVVLVGQPELEIKLDQPKFRPIQQRIALRCQMERFRDQEVSHYIYHRLAVVGSERQDLFSLEAIRQIAEFSKGLPRLINIICDNALFLTYRKLQPTVSAVIVDEVVANLRIVPSRVSVTAFEYEGQFPDPTEVPVGHRLQEAYAIGAPSQGARFLANNARVAFFASAVRFRGYSASFFFLALALGLLVYGKQGAVGTVTESRLPIITNVVPKGQTLAVQAGQAQRFAVELQELDKDATMKISWLLDGQRVAGGLSWVFIPPVTDSERRYAVTATVTEARGRRVERQWSVAVARTVVPAPRIIAAQPAGQEIRVAEGQKVTFMVDVSQPQPDLRYTWLLDGQEQAQEKTWTYEARLTVGRPQTVTVQIEGAHKQVVERSWKIEVQKVDHPPAIAKATPADQAVTVRAGESQHFTIEVTDPDSDNFPRTLWLLDGQAVARGPSWTFTPIPTETSNQHRVTVTVSDKKDRIVEKQWTVTVE